MGFLLSALGAVCERCEVGNEPGLEACRACGAPLNGAIWAKEMAARGPATARNPAVEEARVPTAHTPGLAGAFAAALGTPGPAARSATLTGTAASLGSPGPSAPAHSLAGAGTPGPTSHSNTLAGTGGTAVGEPPAWKPSPPPERSAGPSRPWTGGTPGPAAPPVLSRGSVTPGPMAASSAAPWIGSPDGPASAGPAHRIEVIPSGARQRGRSD
ncbi:MAG TPA: hypothetical protein VGD74_12435, partial [Vulgatibacter sp.]